MGLAAIDKYEIQRSGEWKLLVHPERWSPLLWAQVLEILKGDSPARHPRVKGFYLAAGTKRDEFYLKTYYCPDALGKIKSLFRDSKAFCALKQGQTLQRKRFNVPPVVAAGEERKRGILMRAFLLTLGVEGLPLPIFLKPYDALPPRAGMIKQKRECLEQLATEIRRLHRLGFVHGDLTPYNLFVRSDGDGVSFFLMDNDRTRRYPPWFLQRLWKRNLLQLNRFKLPGISLQDRVRFLRSYLEKSCERQKELHLLHWLEARTRKRRAWKDRFRGEVSFRELMRWDGVFAKKTNLN
jgi:Lipopolysaccharide kinase (Kdo/WaaP) family